MLATMATNAPGPESSSGRSYKRFCKNDHTVLCCESLRDAEYRSALGLVAVGVSRSADRGERFVIEWAAAHFNQW